MTQELDWSGLAGSVSRAAAQLTKLREENRALRKEVRDLRKQLESRSEAADASATLSREVGERLRRLESELRGLAPSS